VPAGLPSVPIIEMKPDCADAGTAAATTDSAIVKSDRQVENNLVNLNDSSFEDRQLRPEARVVHRSAHSFSSNTKESPGCFAFVADQNHRPMTACRQLAMTRFVKAVNA
jgi:hypothetical protein